MEQLIEHGSLIVCQRSKEELFLRGRFKICADIKLPGQKPVGELTAQHRAQLGRVVIEKLLDTCPDLGPAFVSIDEVKEGAINVGIFTDDRRWVSELRDASGIHPKFACDLLDPKKPVRLPEKEWVKQ